MFWDMRRGPRNAKKCPPVFLSVCVCVCTLLSERVEAKKLGKNANLNIFIYLPADELLSYMNNI